MSTFTLTGEQAAFVSAKEQIVIGLAGPGSGKTTTIGEMIRQFPDEQCAATALITFTNDAAARLKMKAGSRKMFFAGTMHSFCFRTLREHGEKIGLPKGLIPVDEAAATALLKTCMEELRSTCRVQDAAGAIVWNPLVQHNSDQETPSVRAQAVARLYYTRLLENRLIDYDGMLSFGHELFLSHPEVPRPRFLVVDEAQDVSGVDWNIYKLLNCERYWIVGDLDQSVYSFRGAAPQRLLDLCGASFARVYKIQNNYRSGPGICDPATRLIGRNQARVDKPVIAANPNQVSSISYSRFRDEDEELDSVVEWAKQNPTGAILFRTNAPAYRYRTAITAAGIKVSGKADKPEDYNFIMALLSAVAHPYNDELFNTFLVRFKGSNVAKTARMEAAAAGQSIYEYFNARIPWLNKHVRVAGDFNAIMELVLRQASPETSDILKACMPCAESIDELVLASAGFIAEQKGEGVWCGTIHRSKGLEWDSVRLPAWNMGTFPWRASFSEEERRLAFVAVTRGITSVIVSSSETIRDPIDPNSTKTVAPSVFVGELGIPMGGAL
jgi:DNA helicase-2/ATP-dependent DNA helicase PcrA